MPCGTRKTAASAIDRLFPEWENTASNRPAAIRGKTADPLTLTRQVLPLHYGHEGAPQLPRIPEMRHLSRPFLQHQLHMQDSSSPIRIKVIRKSTKASPDETDSLLWDGCLFCTDAAMTDYDWVLVYDEFPRHDIGTIRNETEPLLCPPDQTILITVEPPSIKIYSRAYTHQFGTVLTTHSPTDLPHPNHTLGRGCLEWLYIKPMQEILDQKEFPKTKMLSTICSAKQHTHTMHKMRYDLTRYLADRLPELDWFGHGIREIDNKTVAMDDYKYHLCVENHLEPHHWTEKLADAFVAMTLPFYAGAPLATECFPPESFIPVPMDDPGKAFEIIRKSMDDGEYEKRLPAIREARRLVLEKYNMFAQTAAVIRNHRGTGIVRPGAILKGRHVLRKNPVNAVRELIDTLAYKIRSRKKRKTGTPA